MVTETPKKRDPWTYVLIVSAAAGVCLVVSLCLQAFGLVLPGMGGRREVEAQGVRLGAEAPDFLLDGLQGPVRLSDQRGRAVLLNFWTSWCGHCVAEMPMIEEYARRYANQLIVLAVNEGESAQTVRDFARAYPYSFTYVLDPHYELNDPYRLQGYPTTYFIDAAGIVRYEVVGSMSRADIQTGLWAAGVGR